jgi:hypothetical protein
VHFVVSVSMEALASFELRGVHVRDAFDSSFDMIIEVQPMTGLEALAVLESRVAGFPPLAGAACHAWSGGLPRELLRIARRMIEVNRDSGIASPILHVFREVLVEDLLAKVNALSRSTKYEGDLKGVTEALAAYRRRSGVPADRAFAGLPPAFADSPLGRRLELGGRWIDYLERSAPTSKTDWTFVSEDVLRVADEVAEAIARSAASGGLAEETHKRAMAACQA